MDRLTRIGSSGRASEGKTAKRLGMKLTPASGARAHSKGDMRSETVLLEAKSSLTGQVTLLFSWLANIAKHAREKAMVPALSITFIDSDSGTPRPNGRWVMIPEERFKELMDARAIKLGGADDPCDG
jgi:hypothetical protein